MGTSRAAFFLVLVGLLASPAVAVLPAIGKVVTMLNNLVTMMESEAADDEKKFNHFSQFAAGEKEAASAKISEMQTKIEDTNAVLTDLRAQKAELDEAVGKLNSQIDVETSQVNDATEKRAAENDAFTKEQMDFSNAIAACAKAAKLLGAHYGDGTKEDKRPSWMSLVDTELVTVRQAAETLSAKGHKGLQAVVKGHKKGLLMLQGKADPYEAKTDDALNIVDQIKMLSSTFAEDKQSAVEEENRLQKSFDNLIKRKREILGTLTGERDTQQAQLNQVNQDVAEQESALKMAQEVLTDQQTYLASVTKQLEEITEMYNIRKKDREAETKAVNEALGVLESVTFVQVSTVDEHQDEHRHHGKSLDKLLQKHRQPQRYCENCAKVAAMLRQKAKVYHSAVLSAAAATSMGSDAIDGVIDNLKELIKRIDEEQKTEKEHKNWCDEETGLTTTKRDDHSHIVDSLKATIADLGEVIKEKDIGLDQNQENIHDEDDNFDEMTEIRAEQKGEFEEDLQDHLDAIQALNEAIEILANFYAKRNEGAAVLLQKGVHRVQVSPHKGAAFLQHKGGPPGGKVVGIMSGVRKEFEEAKHHLEEEETEAVKLFEETKKEHKTVDGDLHSDRNTLTVEQQTAEVQLENAEHDKGVNEGEVKAADDYLKQLGKSCFPLIMHFDERTRLRKEEKGAIKDAIKVLREA